MRFKAKVALQLTSLVAIAIAVPAMAQSADAPADPRDSTDDIVVTGLRASLRDALRLQRVCQRH